MIVRLLALITVIALLNPGAHAQDPQPAVDAPKQAPESGKEAPATKEPAVDAEEIAAARNSGLDWLAKNQQENGSWRSG